MTLYAVVERLPDGRVRSVAREKPLSEALNLVHCPAQGGLVNWAGELRQEHPLIQIPGPEWGDDPADRAK